MCTSTLKQIIFKNFNMQRDKIAVKIKATLSVDI